MVCKCNTLHWDIIFQIKRISISAFQHQLTTVYFWTRAYKNNTKTHTSVVWANFSSPITCGTERVGALFRRMVSFLTRESFQKSLPDMLAVGWYYSDTGLDHNYKDICVLTQLPRKSCTATKSLKWLWQHFWQGIIKITIIVSYIKMIVMRSSKWPGTALLSSIKYL